MVHRFAPEKMVLGKKSLVRLSSFLLMAALSYSYLWLKSKIKTNPATIFPDVYEKSPKFFNYEAKSSRLPCHFGN